MDVMNIHTIRKHTNKDSCNNIFQMILLMLEYVENEIDFRIVFFLVFVFQCIQIIFFNNKVNTSIKRKVHFLNHDVYKNVLKIWSFFSWRMENKTLSTHYWNNFSTLFSIESCCDSLISLFVSLKLITLSVCVLNKIV